MVDESQLDGQSSYAGRWIARIGGQIVGHGGTPEQALNSAQASRFKEIPQVYFVTHSDQITFHPIIEKLAKILPTDPPIYLVGGAIRNKLTNRDNIEFDFTLPGKAIPTARKAADELNGAFYILDKERDFGRAIIPDSVGKPVTLDFSPFQGRTLEDDLKSRDFTINAMAVDISHPNELLDPLGGAIDLHGKKLRVCSPDSISKDPIRILRGIRFSLIWELRTEPDTKDRMRDAVALLPLISAERIRDELFKLLDCPKPAAAIRIIDQLEATKYVLPELSTLQGLPQSPPHIQDVWKHTLEVVSQLYKIIELLQPNYNLEGSVSLHLGVISHRMGRYREQLADHLQTRLVQSRSLISLILFAALYHDIGKPSTKEIDQDGHITFLGHEKSGAELISFRGRNLQLSNIELKRLGKIVSNHMRPLWLANTGKLPSRRATFRFFRDTGLAGVDICILSLADTLATYGPTLPPDIWAHQVEVVRTLLEAWWEKKEEVVTPPPVVNGDDLINELGLKPGPKIGQILRSIQEAQATGKVINRRQALELANEFILELNDEGEL
jgi:putative nucleotidyltransferase with HDIG domain